MSIVSNTVSRLRASFESHERLALALLVIAATVTPLFIIGTTPLDLSGDEAYYWHWSQRLDLSYYEKGPGIAYLIAFACRVFGNTPFGVRVSAAICQGLICVLLTVLSARHFSLRVTTKILLLYCSTLMFSSLPLFMTCDPPLCLLWLVALGCAIEAVVKDRPVWWLGAGIAVGGAALFKYSSLVLFPSFAAFLLCTPARRHHLLRPEFWGGVALAGFMLTPVIIWNARNGWSNVQENFGHLHGRAFRLKARALPELIGGQWGLIGLLLFPLLIVAHRAGYRAWRERGDLLAGVLLFAGAPLALYCVALSLVRSVYANWPMPIYLSAFLLLGVLYAREEREGVRPRYLRFRPVFLANVGLTCCAYLLMTGATFGLPPSLLPTKKLIGWRALGEAVSLLVAETPRLEVDVRASNRAGADGLPFVISEKYMTGAEVGFYAEPRLDVVVSDPDQHNMNQFVIWARGHWPELRGRNALLVLSDPKEAEDFRPHFARVTPAEPATLVVRYGASTLRTFYFFRAENFDGAELVAAETGLFGLG